MQPFCLTVVLCVLTFAGLHAEASPAESDGARARAYWVATLTRIADPVLTALADNRLKADMPVRAARRDVSPLEAVGRTLAGLAPWLELGPDDTPEGRERARFIDLATRGLAHAVDPAAPDRLNFSRGGQPLVDAAFLAHALLRAPRQLWGNLDATTRERLVAALKETRAIKPPESNWLLFSAMVETALWRFTGECDQGRVEYAVNRHLEWYKGDGTYGDGPDFHWDYYNSFVIQPMLLDAVAFLQEKGHLLGAKYPLVLARARRYAQVQERLISPEGTFPVLGRSSAYRFGAFQTLAQVAWRGQLPPEAPPGAVRAGLTAVIRRMVEAPGTFDAHGWLKTGVAGDQPAVGEGYISTGSLYLCTVGLLPLGLPPDDPFWTVPDAPWTQKRLWAGEDVPSDHALTK